jgi:glutamine amidotransferase
MGWNNCMTLKGELFKGLTIADDLYFVHSYYAEISSETLATCDYIVPFSAAMRTDNFFATQFHPEKSAEKGEIILKNFLEL